MMRVRLTDDGVRIGRHFTVSFQRTLRIPDDGGTYPLPPGLGRLPVRRVADYAARVPAAWRRHGGVFLPMYQREAMWLSFGRPHWRPCAVKVAVGKVNAVSGKPWSARLEGTAGSVERPVDAGRSIGRPAGQDYIVCPDQPWLDGINAGDGFIRQFVAMPLGMGYTVEGQVTGKEEFGGIQIMVFEPKPGRFPDRPPSRSGRFGRGGGAWPHEGMVFDCCCCSSAAPAGAEMGLAAGGRMRQEIYPDAYGIETWDETQAGRLYVHIVNSMVYREITGEEPPETPISARTYTEHGLPWFELFGEGKGDVKAAETLAGVKSVKEMDEEKGFGVQQDDGTVEVKAGQVKVIWDGGVKGKAGDPGDVVDGEW